MSRWTERIRDHSVWRQMESLGPALDRAALREGTDPSTHDGLERIRAILTFVGKRLAGADPQLMHPDSLDGIAGALESTVSEIDAFVADGDASRLASANSHADNILGRLPGINYPFVADDWIALSTAGVAYRATLERGLEEVLASFSRIRGEAADLGQRIPEIAAAIEAERAKLIALGTDCQSQYLAAEEKRNVEFADRVQAALAQLAAESTTVQQRLSELASEITTERGRLTGLGADFQSQFSSAQEGRSREFAEVQTSRQDKFAALMADSNQRLADQNSEFVKQRDTAVQRYQSDVTELNERYAQEARSILSRIEIHEKDVEKLVGVIGNLGVTSGYLRAANQARVTTWVWQTITVLSMVAVIFFAFRAFLPLTEGAFSWPSFAGRVVLSLAVGVLAAYAAAQGDRYLEIERRNRKLALELEAIGPYLAPLPDDKQQEFRLQLGDRTFGREEAGVGRAAAKSPASVIDILLKSKEFRTFVAEIVKAAHG